MPGVVDFTGLISARDKAEIRTEVTGSSEPSWIVNGGGEGQRGERPHSGKGHEPSAGFRWAHEMLDVGVEGGDCREQAIAKQSAERDK